MSDFRLSPEAEADLGSIWLYIARESQSIEIATDIVEGIFARFWLLASQPHIGRRRDDFGPELRSFVADGYLLIYEIDRDERVIILRVLHGSRDIGALFTS
jgi:toxin ParE1/3/4